MDDNTVVLVADPTFGNVLNFNIGINIDSFIPRVRASLVIWLGMLGLGGGTGLAAPGRPSCSAYVLACLVGGVLRGSTQSPLSSFPPAITNLQNFWSKVAGRFGNKFYVEEQGRDVAIINAVAAVDHCLREPIDRTQCSEIRGELE